MMDRQTICSVFISVLTVANVFAIDLPELRELLKDERSAIKTGHLIYIEENMDRRLDAKGATNGTLAKSHSSIIKVEKFLDYQNQQTKTIQTVHSAQKNLLEERTTLNQSGNVMSLLAPLSASKNYSLILHPLPDSSPKSINTLFRDMFIGLVPLEILSEKENTEVRIIESHTGNMLRMQITRTQIDNNGNEVVYEGAIECDLEHDCRFRIIQWKKNGHLTSEVVAEDYRKIGDRSFPFRYVTRSFDHNGKIVKGRTLKFEKVELNVNFPPEAFKIYIPSGTKLTDAVMTMGVREIKEEGYMNISDVLHIETNKIAAESIKNLDTFLSDSDDLNKKQAKRKIFIPEASNALREGIPFVLSLQKIGTVTYKNHIVPQKGYRYNLPIVRTYQSPFCYRFLTHARKSFKTSCISPEL